MIEHRNRTIAPAVDKIALQLGDFSIDLDQRILFRGAQRVSIAPKPLEVLEVLGRNAGRTVSKQELLASVWGEEFKDKNTVEQAVRQIRIALGDNADQPRYIQTVPRRGYCFIIPVEPSPAIPTKRSHPVRWYFWTFAVLVSVVFAFRTLPFFRSRPSGIPARFNFLGDTVTVQDGEGNVLWSHRFGGLLDPGGVDAKDLAGIGRLVRLADLRGDGEHEVLIAVPTRASPNPQDGDHIEVDCFSIAGKLLWSYTPHETLRFPGLDLGGPWFLSDVLVSQRGSDRSIYAIFAQISWGHSFVARIDPLTGKGKMFFVNTGTLRSLNQLSIVDTTYLLVGGFNNEYDGGSVAVIDEKKSFASSPQSIGTRHQCLSCPAGVPDYYFVFPRSELNRLNKFNENSVVNMEVRGRELLVRKRESPSATEQQTLYLFNFPPLPKFISLRFETHYDLTHRELEKNGQLDHSLSNCPERLHPRRVRVWTPADGWSFLSVTAIQ